MRSEKEIQGKVVEYEDLIEYYREKQSKITLSDKTTPDERHEYMALAQQIMATHACINTLNWALGKNEQAGINKIHKVCNPPKIKGEEWMNR